MPNHTRNVVITFILLVVVAISMLFFLTGCSAYKKVAQKANPTAKERSLLAIACAREYPTITNTFTIDSTIASTRKNYSKQIDSLTNLIEILDSLIHEQIPIIDTAFVDSSNCLPRIKIAYSQIEKLNVQRNNLQASIILLKNDLQRLRQEYKPCDSVVKQTSVITQCDSARMQILHDRANNAEKKNIILETKLEDKSQQSKNRLWIIFVLAGVIAIGIFLKIKKII